MLKIKIENATLILNGITIGSGIGQVAQDDYDALEKEITTAQGIYDDRVNQTQAQLNGATMSLENVINLFNNSIVKVGDATALQERIDSAILELNKVTIGTGVGQVAQEDSENLAEAIAIAQGIYDDKDSKNQAQLDTATTSLEYAITVFSNNVISSGDPTSLTNALSEARTLYQTALEGTEAGQYVVGSKSVFNSAIDTAQEVLDAASSKTTQQLATAQEALLQATTNFESSTVIALTGLQNVTVTATATDSSNHVSLGNGETFFLISSNNAVATVTEDSSGTIKVTGIAPGEAITITVQVKKDGQIIKTGSFTVTTVAPMSITSKTISNLDFSTVLGTQAKLVSIPVMDSDFTHNPKNFTITVKKGERIDVIPVFVSWNITAGGYSKGLSMGSVVESSIQQFYVNKDIANGDSQYTELMTRPVMATGNYENDQFYIGTSSIGSQATITLGGADWSYFFGTNHAAGTDSDTSKNRIITVSDGTKTTTITLTSKFNTIDALVNSINNRLTTAGVAAKAEKVNTSQFKITLTSSLSNLTIGGVNKEDLFD